MNKDTQVSRKLDERIEGKVPPLEGKEPAEADNDAGEDPAEEAEE